MAKEAVNYAYESTLTAGLSFEKKVFWSTFATVQLEYLITNKFNRRIKRKVWPLFLKKEIKHLKLMKIPIPRLIRPYLINFPLYSFNVNVFYFGIINH